MKIHRGRRIRVLGYGGGRRGCGGDGGKGGEGRERREAGEQSIGRGRARGATSAGCRGAGAGWKGRSDEAVKSGAS